MPDPGSVVRVAAMGDLHCSKKSQGQFQALFTAAAELADILLICGDLTDYGLPEEAHILSRRWRAAPSCRRSPCWATMTSSQGGRATSGRSSSTPVW